MKYAIDGKQFATIQEAGAAYKPGDFIRRADGSTISSTEIDQALSAWLRSKKKAAA